MIGSTTFGIYAGLQGTEININVLKETVNRSKIKEPVYDDEVKNIVQEIKSLAGCYIPTNAPIKVQWKGGGKVSLAYSGKQKDQDPYFQHLIKSMANVGKLNMEQIERAFKTLPK